MDNKETSPDLGQLRGYTQNKQAIADQLRSVRLGLAALGRTEAARAIGEVMVKLAEDRFVLAVVGQFKRGKSSLMNAVIGQELLPTGILPLTSAITVLHYGPKPQLVVTRAGLSFPDRRPLEDLPELVTERGNPGNVKGVATVRVELPVPFLRYGIEFVDTPGIGSAITANTQTTYQFLPECDAVLFVTAADSPMTEAELAFLRDLRPYVGKVFFILNKIDVLKPGEREEMREYVGRTIQETIGEAGVTVFELSSLDGLHARMAKDVALYKESGLMRLEEELGRFLSREKADYFLLGVIRRAGAVIEDEKSLGGFGEEALKARAAEIAQQRVKTTQQEPALAVETVLQAAGKLVVLAESIKRGEEVGGAVGHWSAETAGRAGVEMRDIGEQAEARPVTLEDRGCPICTVMKKQVFDFLVHWQYELSSLEAAQALFADELGFCSLHSWQLLAISSPYGASVGYARLADTLAARLRAEDMLVIGNVGRLRRVGGTCRVCGVAGEFEPARRRGG